jgi:hypothetical protein
MKKTLITLLVTLLTVFTIAFCGVSPVLAAAPANDNFNSAAAISTVPYNTSVDIKDATIENDEPSPGGNTIYHTVWYSYTPTASGTIVATIETTEVVPMLGVYTGGSISTLSQIAFSGWGSVELALILTAGSTYYFQVGSLFDYSVGTVQFGLELAPPPTVSFSYLPVDPSTFDTVQFNGPFDDQIGIPVQSWAWDFGDGTTSSVQNPTHQYAKDGDYTVTLAVIIIDGRTGSDSQVVPVRTHDIAITKFSVPQSASSGQTRKITIGISNTRYAENVRVEIYKSTPGGFQNFGMLIQSVPVRVTNRTTDFSFNYTFTKEDASLGKVTFRAVATIGTRDALPGDNEAISLPVKIQK